jgi:transcriptional regulator with XRE-family HTH domain
MQTGDLERARFQLVAAEFLVRMGARIRKRRDELELSRADVAREMPGKVSENQLYRWEKGLHQPQPETLEALAKVLQCDVAFFVSPEPDKRQTPSPFRGAGSAAMEEQLAQVAEQVSEIHALLLGDDEAGVAGLAARLLQAAGSPPPRAADRAAIRAAAAKRRRA